MPISAQDKPTVNIVFTMSAAGSIRRALAKIGRTERVIGFPDDLRFGPIDPPDAGPRQQWVEELLGYDWADVVRQGDFFWTEATAPDILPVAWFSRRDAAEYAAFLEFVQRMADSPFRIVDATDAGTVRSNGEPRRFALSSLSLLSSTQIVEACLLDQQRVMAQEEIERALELWRRLKRENAALRIVNETGLASAPIKHFDDAILSCADDEWRKGALVVGRTIAALMDGPFDRSPSDLVLWARACALANDGALEMRGDGVEMRGTEVRRRRTR